MSGIALQRSTIYPTIQRVGKAVELDELETFFKERAIEFRGKDSAERTFLFRASDETVDRYGDIISKDGWDLKWYKKNPVILYMHDHKLGPIGMSLNESIEDDGLNMLVYIHDLTEKSREVFSLLDANMIRMSSVGFRGLATKDLTDAERNELKMGRWGIYYTKAELHELSIVTVPANPNAAMKTGLQEQVAETVYSRIIKQFEETGIFERAKMFAEAGDKLSSLEKKFERLLEASETKLAVQKEETPKIAETDLEKILKAIKS